MHWGFEKREDSNSLLEANRQVNKYPWLLNGIKGPMELNGASQVALVEKNPLGNAGDVGSISWSGRSLGI